MGGGGGTVGTGKYTPEQLKGLLPPGAWIPPAGTAPMTIKEYESVAKAGETGKKAGDETEADKRTRELTISGPLGVLKNKGDKQYLAPDADSARLTRKKVAAAREVTDMLDQVLAIRDKVGGESAIVNSDEFQKLKLLQSRLVKIEKSGTEGMSSDEDMKKLADAIGAADITSFRARAAGLKEGRDRTVGELNTWLESQNYDGPAITIPSKYGEPVLSPDQAKVKKLTESETGAVSSDAVKGTAPAILALPGIGQLAFLGSLVASGASSPNVNLPDGDEKNVLKEIGAKLSSKEEKERTTAYKDLRELGINANSPAIRAFAIRTLAEFSDSAATRVFAPEKK